jgi:maltooligosyltrehalose trehalohydrolase
MQPTDSGWQELAVPVAPGTRYTFHLPDGSVVPDPASRFQPEDARGPSEVIDRHSYAWRDERWRGRPWHEAVIYELHVGTFTPAGSFREAATRLPDLADLGVSAIELMPVGDFPGTRNWGYDGVFPFAPESSYGRPDDLKLLVDTAHDLGLMVLLDVVYNHFGPEGNWLTKYAPRFFTERHHTPWGAGINFDGEDSAPVRAFFIENACYWIEQFHLDGLRLDATHAILDDSSLHILDEIAQTVRRRTAHRHVHLVLENEENETRRLLREPDGSIPGFSAQWNDDLHHVLHTATTRESAGYYQDYVGNDLWLARAIAEGFAFQGEHMSYRGSSRGEPSAHLPPDAFVAFLQNHDQIGNRAMGDRLIELAPVAALRAATAVLLLLPQIPMLFMGEEWGARQPFAFFCDFHGELADAVRNGRREEFARFPEFADPHTRDRIPDPQAPDTFLRSRLDWNARTTGESQQWLDFYRRLLAMRRSEIVPRLPRIAGYAGKFLVLASGVVSVNWRVGDDEQLLLLANLSPVAALVPPQESGGHVIWQEGGEINSEGIAPWTVRWSVRRCKGAV